MLNRVRAALHPLRLVGLFFRSTHTSRLCAMSAGSVSASSGRVDAVGSANPTTRVIDTAADSTAAGPGRAGEEVGGGEGEKPQVQLPKGNNLVMQIILRRDLLTVSTSAWLRTLAVLLRLTLFPHVESGIVLTNSGASMAYRPSPRSSRTRSNSRHAHPPYAS